MDKIEFLDMKLENPGKKSEPGRLVIKLDWKGFRWCIQQQNSSHNPGFPIWEQFWKETLSRHFPRITAIPRSRLWTREWQPVLQVQTAFDVHRSAVPISPSRNKILGFILVLLIWWSTVFFWSETVTIGNEDARWQYHIEEITVTQRKILQAPEPSRHSPGTHKLGKQQTNNNYICYLLQCIIKHMQCSR